MPHASLLEPHPPIVVGGGCGFACGAGWDRLNTEDCIVGDAIVCFGTVAGGDGAEKSKRSPKAEVFEAGAGDKPDAESNAPKLLDELKPRDAWGC